jgi:hypothetical protein
MAQTIEVVETLHSRALVFADLPLGLQFVVVFPETMNDGG